MQKFTWPGATFSAAVLLFAPGLLSAALVHDYQLQGSLNDNLGGPALVSLGGSVGPTGYKFGANQGLSVRGAWAGTAEVYNDGFDSNPEFAASTLADVVVSRDASGGFVTRIQIFDTALDARQAAALDLTERSTRAAAPEPASVVLMIGTVVVAVVFRRRLSRIQKGS